MDHFKKEMVPTEDNPFFDNINIWERYIDDIFIIWKGSKEEATTFVTWLNALNPFLRFTSTMGDRAISFLDLLITEKNGLLKTEVYYKPTDRNNVLQFRSFHPRSLRENLPVGQFLRLRRKCTELTDFKKHAKKLTDKLQARGYPAYLLRRAEKRARFSNRETLLQPTTRTNKEDTLICVTTFNPASDTIKKIINEDWKILTSGGLPFQLPLNAFKKAKSIRDMIVHTRPRDNLELWQPHLIEVHFSQGDCISRLPWEHYDAPRHVRVPDRVSTLEAHVAAALVHTSPFLLYDFRMRSIRFPDAGFFLRCIYDTPYQSQPF
ncbi:hypothetical protein NDU88_005690 [Pleurodeles waltl]|uniref:Helix-turn-helix domain-containing protein n=1 Tax=Pleurodeles waltl TaxID=8319 RepID=A0AAV7MDN4_PLEWA|nr:hypothetical protein NDU88_005690 [Pleurodeles waltl]